MQEREKAAKDKKKEIRGKLLELIKDDYTRSLFWKTSAMIVLSKTMAIASPWFLKAVVDGMALGTQVDLKMACLGIGAFGLTRLLSTLVQEERMYKISQII